MKLVDLSHLMNVHTPGWVGYAGNQMWRFKSRADDHAPTRARAVSATPASSDGASATAKTRRQRGSKLDADLECAPDSGQIAGWELTRAAGLSEDESHGQAPHP